jgi:hypothetical protein
MKKHTHITIVLQVFRELLMISDSELFDGLGVERLLILFPACNSLVQISMQFNSFR